MPYTYWKLRLLTFYCICLLLIYAFQLYLLKHFNILATWVEINIKLALHPSPSYCMLPPPYMSRPHPPAPKVDLCGSNIETFKHDFGDNNIISAKYIYCNYCNGAVTFYWTIISFIIPCRRFIAMLYPTNLIFAGAFPLTRERNYYMLRKKSPQVKGGRGWPEIWAQ